MTEQVNFDDPLAGGPPKVFSDEATSAGIRLPWWVRAIRMASIVLAVAGAIACAALMLHVIADVTGRTFFNHPLPGTLEVTEHWWMITIVFAALGYTQVQREHIRATAITELMSHTWQRVSEAVTCVLLGVLAVFLTIYSWQAAVESHAMREATSSAPPITIWPFLYLMPLGAVALLLQSISSIYEIAKDVNRTSHSEELI